MEDIETYCDIYIIMGKTQDGGPHSIKGGSSGGGPDITNIPKEVFEIYLGSQEKALLGTTCKEFSTFKIKPIDAIGNITNRIVQLMPNDNAKAVLYRNEPNSFSLKALFSISNKGVWMAKDFNKSNDMVFAKLKIRGMTTADEDLKDKVKNLLETLFKLYDSSMSSLEIGDLNINRVDVTSTSQHVVESGAHVKGFTELNYLSTSHLIDLIEKKAKPNEIIAMIRNPDDPRDVKYFTLMKEIQPSPTIGGCNKKRKPKLHSTR